MIHTEPLRKCNNCDIEAHTEEDLEKFSRNTSCLHGRASECKLCTNARRNKYRQANPELHRENNMRYHCINTYKITLEEYRKRMKTSDCCGICSKEADLCYDHDHDTMEFRGVLCRVCNKGLGSLGDTLEGLKKAVKYLESQ